MSSSDRPTDLGINRTGIALSPIDGPATIEGANAGIPTSGGSARAIAELRMDYARSAEPIGHMPPPVTVRGAAKAVSGLIKGQKPTVLLDKLGERLAFERTGVRLFDGLIAKFEASGTWRGGPSLQELTRFREQEHQHLLLMKETLERMGADPTAMTPSADLVGVASIGLLQVITDPRTTLAQSLQAHLTAELTDVAGWELLISLSEGIGQEALLVKFRDALANEVLHSASVQRWLAAHAQLNLKGEHN